MAPVKRKAIVFDLEGGSKCKRPRVHKRPVHTIEHYEEEAADNWVSYMQPEILTITFMMELLQQCHIGSSILTGKSKKEIEKLFLKYVSPKPQRKYGSSRVGKALALLQKKLGGSDTPEWYKYVVESSGPRKTHGEVSSVVIQGGNSIPSLSTATGNDRLKPPLIPNSLINTTKKTIKLGTTTNTTSFTLNIKQAKPTLVKGEIDKIDSLLIIPHKKVSFEKESATTAQVKRKITLSKSKEEVSPKKIKSIIRNTTCKPEPPKGIKHSSVSWP